MPRYYRFAMETKLYPQEWRGYAQPGTFIPSVQGLGSTTYPTALRQNGGVSLLSTGPELSHLNDEPLSGLFDLSLSDNETRLALGVGIAIAGYFGWRWWKERR